MMAYIDKELAEELLKKEAKADRSRAYGEHECDIISAVYENARQIISNIPVAAVVEAKHGEWIDDGDCFHCSVCNKPYQFGSLQTIDDVRRCWKCCANCGAIMSGERSDNMTDEQINEIVQISESIRNCYLNALERTDADREYREGQRNIAKWLEELKRHKEETDVRSQKWIDVNEELPENYMNCLVYYKHAYNNEDGYWAIGVSYYNGEKFLIDWVYQVTHWMPLPEPPEEDDNNG